MVKSEGERPSRTQAEGKYPKQLANPSRPKVSNTSENPTRDLAVKFTDSTKTLALNIIRTDGNDSAVDALAKVVGGPKMTRSKLNARIFTNASGCLKDFDWVALAWYAIVLAAKRTGSEPAVA